MVYGVGMNTDRNTQGKDGGASMYVVAVRGMNYVIIDTRNGQVQTPAYITRTKAERACADINERS